jgi:MBG domain (YGX type)
VADLTGTLDLSSPAGATSLPGIYPIIPSGVSSLNYAVTFVNGELLVGQAAPPVANARDAAVTRSETAMTIPATGGGCAAPLTPGLINIAMAPGLCIERPSVR